MRNVGRAMHRYPTLLRFGDHGTKKCWELLAQKFDRFQTLRNNSEQRITTHNRVCKRTQHVTSKNVESCWPTLLRLFAWGLMFGVQNKLAPANVQKNNSYIAWCTFPQNKISRKIFLDLCHAIDRMNQFFICFLFVCIHPQTNQLSA